MFANLINLDESTYLKVVKLQQKPKTLLAFRAFSFTGDGYLYPFVILAIVLLDPAQSLFCFVVTGFAFCLELPLFVALKRFFKRHRPFDQMTHLIPVITPSDKFSLPSGHSASAFCMATIISAWYPLATPLLFTWAGLVGLSRVVLGVHYPLDILFGALLGMSCAWASLTFLQVI